MNENDCLNLFSCLASESSYSMISRNFYLRAGCEEVKTPREGEGGSSDELSSDFSNLKLDYDHFSLFDFELYSNFSIPKLLFDLVLDLKQSLYDNQSNFDWFDLSVINSLTDIAISLVLFFLLKKLDYSYLMDFVDALSFFTRFGSLRVALTERIVFSFHLFNEKIQMFSCLVLLLFFESPFSTIIKILTLGKNFKRSALIDLFILILFRNENLKNSDYLNLVGDSMSTQY
ncbi:hypothetical protein P9112_001039 [Eukaryota sp. TZLM1-RC]